MGARPETTATLGDRIDTDMIGGARAGLRTIMVLSGSTGRAEAEAYGPDLIFEDIAGLTQAWHATLAPNGNRGQPPDVHRGQAASA